MAFLRVGAPSHASRMIQESATPHMSGGDPHYPIDVGDGAQGSRFGLGRTQHVTVYAIESGIRRRLPVRVRG